MKKYYIVMFLMGFLIIKTSAQKNSSPDRYSAGYNFNFTKINNSTSLMSNDFKDEFFIFINDKIQPGCYGSFHSSLLKNEKECQTLQVALGAVMRMNF